jgi:uncharacterized protein
MERLFYYPEAGPTPVPRSLPGAEDVHFHSKDGTRLFGWFIPARNIPPNGKAPTVVHMHGNAGNITSHIGFTDFLPEAGFNLFIFDYRGYGQSEGRATKRQPLIADADAAIDAILARKEVDPQRIGMFAQSVGGGIGLNVMAKRPEIRCAVLESSFSSWRDEAADALGRGKPGFISRVVAACLIRDSCRPDQAIARIRRPMLLLHGTTDAIIPVHHSRQLAAAAGEWATLIEFPGGDHNTLHETHPEAVRMIISFFHAQLGAAPVVPTRE